MVQINKKKYRHFIFVSIFLVALIAFLSTEMPGTDFPYNIWRSIYYTLTLFLFGALGIGFPHSGPLLAIIVLWICYFIAPVFAIGYVYKIIEEKFLNRMPYYMKQHSIIFGMSRTGTIMYKIIKGRSAKEKIVIVDNNLDNPNIQVYEKNNSVWLIKNNFENKEVLEKTKIKKAKRVFITTNNDLLNLTLAIQCLKLNPNIDHLYCHVQSYAMYGDFSKCFKRLKDYNKIVMYNRYANAAMVIKNNIIERSRTKNRNGKIFVIMGMGHFGLTLYDQLITDENINKNDEIIIVSLRKFLVFDIKKYDWSDIIHSEKCTIHPPIYSDIHDAESWDKIHNIINGKEKDVNVINCQDNDEATISLAIQLKSIGPKTLRDAVVYCRTFKPISEELNAILESYITENKKKDIVTVSVQEAMEEAYEELIKA